MISKFYSIVRRIAVCASLIGACLLVASCTTPPIGPVVLAASSMQQAMEEAADIWSAQGHERPVLSFAASSALARQIAQGARADLFISADEAWMDFLDHKGLVMKETRADLAGNRLALIAARDDNRAIKLEQLADMLGDSRLAIADPDAVPAGKYAKAALHALDIWDAMAQKLAPAENVRAALALVERRQAPLGIVYESDALASDTVRIIAVFPPSSHPPVRYPLARLAVSSHTQAEGFRRFLLSDPARAVFARHGFEVL